MRVLIRRFCAGLLVSAVWATAGSGNPAVVTYKYDALGRLWFVQYPAGYSITYSYDDAGNRTQVVGVGTQGPVANPDAVLTNVSTPINFDPKSNDTDPNGYWIVITTVGTAAHGSAQLQPNNTVTYTPQTGYAGTDSFFYVISDAAGGSAQATVTVTMQ